MLNQPAVLRFAKVAGAFAIAMSSVSYAAGEVTVYAAASLTNALTEIASRYQERSGTAVKLSFAGSGTLAKQIEARAPADLFISADGKWVDYLDDKGKIDHDSRTDLLGNELTLIAPKGRVIIVTMEPGFPFAAAFEDNLCTGETESVPVGVYAKQALIHLGWWEGIKSRVVGTDDVRAALDLVQRGECVGIVYASDVSGNQKVERIANFPSSSHQSIVYPMVLVNQRSEVRAFYDYLKTAQAVFAKYGFKPLTP